MVGSFPGHRELRGFDSPGAHMDKARVRRWCRKGVAAGVGGFLVLLVSGVGLWSSAVPAQAAATVDYSQLTYQRVVAVEAALTQIVKAVENQPSTSTGQAWANSIRGAVDRVQADLTVTKGLVETLQRTVSKYDDSNQARANALAAQASSIISQVSALNDKNQVRANSLKSSLESALSGIDGLSRANQSQANAIASDVARVRSDVLGTLGQMDRDTKTRVDAVVSQVAAMQAAMVRLDPAPVVKTSEERVLEALGAVQRAQQLAHDQLEASNELVKSTNASVLSALDSFSLMSRTLVEQVKAESGGSGKDYSGQLSSLIDGVKEIQRRLLPSFEVVEDCDPKTFEPSTMHLGDGFPPVIRIKKPCHVGPGDSPGFDMKVFEKTVEEAQKRQREYAESLVKRARAERELERLKDQALKAAENAQKKEEREQRQRELVEAVNGAKEQVQETTKAVKEAAVKAAESAQQAADKVVEAVKAAGEGIGKAFEKAFGHNDAPGPGDGYAHPGSFSKINAWTGSVACLKSALDGRSAGVSCSVGPAINIKPLGYTWRPFSWCYDPSGFKLARDVLGFVLIVGGVVTFISSVFSALGFSSPAGTGGRVVDGGKGYQTPLSGGKDD